MSADEIRKQLQPWVEKHKRKAWAPVLVEGPLTDPKGSHFGGGAWNPEGEEAPKCGRCGEHLRLLLQLDLATVPEAARRTLPATGLLQVFYCEDDQCELEEEGYLAFSPIHRVRIVSAAPGALVESKDPFEPKAIPGWKEFQDAPHPEERDSLGLKLEYDFKAKRVRYVLPEIGLDAWADLHALPIEELMLAADGDKLGGWPHWIQSAEYPACPKCKGEMTNNLFQIESEKGVPFMWGDAGIVQVTQCPKDPEVLTMNWACA